MEQRDQMESWYQAADDTDWGRVFCAVLLIAGVVLQALASLHYTEAVLGPLGGICGILSFIPIARRLGWWKSIAWAFAAWWGVAIGGVVLALLLAPLIGTGY
jgi:hypothetical protein